MKGLVYKEFRQNRSLIFCVLLMPALIAFPACILFLKKAGAEWGEESGKMPVMEMIRNEKGIMIWLMFLGMAFLIAGVWQSTVFFGDDRKAWAMWIAASPEGVNGYIRIKYEVVFVTILMTLFSVQLGNWVMLLVCAAHGVEWFNFTLPMMMISYVQIIARAVDLPFMIRFGAKKGSIIKSTALSVIVIIVLIVLAIRGALNLTEPPKINSGAVSSLFALLPVISIVLYYLSYKLSCRLYMKGAEEFDK